MQGDGVDKDLGRAVDYYRRAADIGVAQARTHTRTQRGEAGGKTGGGGGLGGPVCACWLTTTTMTT